MAHLSEQQISQLKTQLKERRAGLQEHIRQELESSDTERYADLAGKVHDSAEESVADLLTDLSLATIDREVNELRQVEAALQRMSEGTYGECDACGGEIPFERLRTQPAATRCVECQARYEQTHAGPAHPSL